VKSSKEVCRRLQGLVAPTVTPFDDHGALALPIVERLVESLVEGGVAAVIPGDLVGEFFSLTLDERRALLAESVRCARGRLLVVALTADASLDNAIELARFARRTGADLIKLALPYPSPPSESAILDYFRKIDDAEGAPFLVESSDELPIPLPVIAALCERPSFVGLEELGTDLGRLDRLYREFAERLVILPSGETALLFLCLLGAPGLIAAEVNFAPAFMRAFLDACRRRDLDRALELFGRRRRYRDLFRARLARGLPMFTPYAKAALELLGMPVGKPRLPQEPLTPEETRALRDILRAEFGLTDGAVSLGSVGVGGGL
jgi:4-hydroxy-tetrahydrodipicolinate synthase